MVLFDVAIFLCNRFSIMFCITVSTRIFFHFTLLSTDLEIQHSLPRSMTRLLNSTRLPLRWIQEIASITRIEGEGVNGVIFLLFIVHLLHALTALLYELFYPIFGSACYVGKKEWDSAIVDAKECIKVDPTFIKGYYRLASAQLEKNEFEDIEEAAYF